MNPDSTTVRVVKRRPGSNTPTAIESGKPRGTIPMWVVRVLPGEATMRFVVAMHMVDEAGKVCSTPMARRFAELFEARAWVTVVARAARRAVVCLPRAPDDGPDVVEIWV